MSVWFVIPSARPPEEAEKALKLWRERGYKIALLVDWNPPGAPLVTRISQADLFLRGGGKFRPVFDEKTGKPLTEEQTYPPDWNEYPGYARAVNSLIKEVMLKDPSAEWFVTGGDDTEPDHNHSAEEIAKQCGQHFGNMHSALLYQPSTFGVMQPTGDRWTVNGPGTQPGIDLVAGSPWMGREFCRRINQGKGPLWPEYFHCGEDEELQEVATRLGIFWQRPDLTHFHNHWGRPREGERIGQADRMPEFLKRANSPEEWAKFRKLFAERKATGFPGSEPIA